MGREDRAQARDAATKALGRLAKGLSAGELDRLVSDVERHMLSWMEVVINVDLDAPGIRQPGCDYGYRGWTAGGDAGP